MSRDRLCMHCGEPYSEPAMDMAKWEYELFKLGAGCPCCEGDPAKRWVPETQSDFNAMAYNGDEDPFDRIVLMEEDAKRPKWERPKDPVIWTCVGCGVEVIRNVDNGVLEYRVPRDSKAWGWYSSHDFNRLKPMDEPAHVFGKEPVCENCYSTCDGCGEPICATLDYGDVYDDGWCSALEGQHYTDLFCIGCVEAQCQQCLGIGDNCTCCECGAAEGEEHDPECDWHYSPEDFDEDEEE